MTRAKLLVLGLGLALIALFMAPATAGAQDGPTLTADPASVDAAGEATFTLTGEGWTAAPPIFVLPCFGVTTPEEVEADSSGCDSGNLSPATPADGAFEVETTVDVPAEGFCFVAGDQAQTESASVCITVGAAADGGGDEAAADDAAADDAADGGEEDPALAETGVESTLLALLGAAVLGAGVMVFGFSRRFTRS